MWSTSRRRRPKSSSSGPPGVCRAARLFGQACLPVGMGFNTQDLLRTAGTSEGERLYIWNSNSGVTTSTSSNTFDNYAIEDTIFTFDWDEFLPDATSPAVVGAYDVDPSSDEIDIAIRDTVNNVTLASKTGITGGRQFVTVGPTSPQDQTGTARIVTQFRNSNNSTAVSIFAGTFGLGISLSQP